MKEGVISQLSIKAYEGDMVARRGLIGLFVIACVDIVLVVIFSY